MLKNPYIIEMLMQGACLVFSLILLVWVFVDITCVKKVTATYKGSNTHKRFERPEFFYYVKGDKRELKGSMFINKEKYLADNEYTIYVSPIFKSKMQTHRNIFIYTIVLLLLGYQIFNQVTNIISAYNSYIEFFK